MIHTRIVRMQTAALLGDPAEIEEFQFKNDDLTYVELYPYDPY